VSEPRDREQLSLFDGPAAKPEKARGAKVGTLIPEWLSLSLVRATLSCHRADS